ncbi:MAG TPA: hypothetical protein PKD59_12455 [Miltoncostaeaceae bacterium]|nr:hypothetical protein [Miltoncostaeaceae bacterium]
MIGPSVARSRDGVRVVAVSLVVLAILGAEPRTARTAVGARPPRADGRPGQGRA